MPVTSAGVVCVADLVVEVVEVVVFVLDVVPGRVVGTDVVEVARVVATLVVTFALVVVTTGGFVVDAESVALGVIGGPVLMLVGTALVVETEPAPPVVGAGVAESAGRVVTTSGSVVTRVVPDVPEPSAPPHATAHTATAASGNNNRSRTISRRCRR